MLFIFLIGLILPMLKAATISYAYGNYTSLRYQADSGFSCQNGASFTKTITFPGTFTNIPQFIISPYYYDSSSATINEYTFTITSISTTQCQLKISCVKNRLYGYMFNWIAIDDKRVEVINNLNFNVTGISSQKYTFTHSNINALKGYITTTSLGYKGSVDYSLTIDSINTTHVTVQFTTGNTFLMSVGYQIILGTAEAFTNSDLIQTTSMSATSSYTSAVLTLPSGYTFLTPISGLKFTTSQNLRLRECYDSVTTSTGTTIQYSFQTWDASTFTSLTHRLVWMNSQNTKVLYPFRLQKMRTSKLYSMNLGSDAWKLQISELNTIVTSAITQSFTISQKLKKLTITYIYKCEVGKKVTGQIFYCPSCVQQYYTFSQYCYPQINLLTFYIILYQPDSINENIDLAVTATGFQMTESVMNQFSSTSYTLLTLSVV